jgi:hypothetical protein
MIDEMGTENRKQAQSELKEVLDEHHERDCSERETESTAVESHLERALSGEVPAAVEFHIRSALGKLDGAARSPPGSHP